MKINQPKLISSLVKIISYLLIFYILFLLGKSLWTNFNLRKSIRELNEQIISLNVDKKNLENLNLYYQSDAFKELEARRKLGLKSSGEKVLILAVSRPGGAATPTTQNFSDELQKEKETTAKKEPGSPIPNWALWWQYFTK